MIEALMVISMLLGYWVGRKEGKCQCDIEKVALTKSILDKKNYGHNWITRFRK